MENTSSNFIHDYIDKDLAEGVIQQGTDPLPA